MRSSQESARRHSVSSTEDEFVRPHPGRLDDTLQGPRRIRLPRSKSASNMLEPYNDTAASIEDDLRDIVREQVNRQALQELAEFLRTTGPRGSSAQTRYDECFRVPSNGLGPKRWSFQTLKNRRAKQERSSLQTLPENAKPGTTAQGNRYLAISVPEPDCMDGPWGRSQYPVYSADSPKPLGCPDSPSWPARTSSRGALSPTSPNDSSPPVTMDFPTFKGFEFDPERSSAKSSDLAELNRTLERALTLKEDDDGHDVAPPLSDPGRLTSLDLDTETGIISIRPRNGTSSMHSREKAASTASSRLRLNCHIDIEPPKISSDDFTLSSNLASRKPDLANFRVRSAVTPPCMVQPEKQNLPEVRLDVNDEPSALPPRLHSRGLSAFPLASPPGSPPLSRKSRPSNITVGSHLMVPQEAIQPDSPGFPMLLAAMNFPSPPTSSPSHSPTSSISSGSPRPPSEQSTRPKIHPRNSSLRSRKGQELSLDEIVMTPTPTSGHQDMQSAEGNATDTHAALRSEECTLVMSRVTASYGEAIVTDTTISWPEREHSLSSQTDGASETESVTSDTGTFNLDVASSEPPKHGLTRGKEAADRMSGTTQQRKSQRPRSTSSSSTTKPNRCDSSVSFYTADESQRSSMKSTHLTFHESSRLSTSTDDIYDHSLVASSYRQSATTEDSYRQSGLSEDSFRQCRRSDATFATDLSSAMQDSPLKGTKTGRIDSQVVLSTHDSSHISSRKGSIAQSIDSNMDTSLYSSDRSGTPSSLHSTLNDDDMHPRSILERRKARKAKVREYKQKDLASVRTSLHLQNPQLINHAVDSPLLGWFTQSSVKAKRNSALGLSPLSRGAVDAPQSSEPQTPTRNQKVISVSARYDSEALSKLESRSSQASLASTRDAGYDWTISPVMVLENTPAQVVSSNHRSRKSTERKNLTFSPLIVIASVVGRTNTPSKHVSSLRPLSLLTSDPVPILPPRSALRPKVKPQRPLPIKVARMSVSAMPEVREEGNESSGNSIIPTPPISPERSQSTQTSFPAQALPTPPDSGTADTPWDRVSLQRRREKHIMQQKERQENAWLQAHQRERELEWRLEAIKERLRREKIEKEKELADMVATSNDKHLSDTAAGIAQETAEDNETRGPNMSNHCRAGTEVEQRLDRLEKSGDAYLRIMVPLLENMNRTLMEMRKDGMASTMNLGISMSDFKLDRSAEGKKLSLVESFSTTATRRSSTAAATAANAVNASLNASHKRQSLPAHRRDRSGSKSSAGSQKLSARVEMNMSRPRSRRNTQTSARSEVFAINSKQSSESSRYSHETFQTGRSSSPDKHHHLVSTKPLPSVPQSPLLSKALPTPPVSTKQSPSLVGPSGGATATIRTPEDHQDEAFQAIQRRMEKQEAIFDQLMSGWATGNKKKSMTKKGSTKRPRSSTLPSRQTPLAEEEDEEMAECD